MKSTIRTQLPEISIGHHSCLLFSTPQEQIEATVPFMILGLERNEQSVYVGDDRSIELIRTGLKSAGVDVERETAKNRLALSSKRDYLEDGHFSSDRMLAFLQQTYDQALTGGFSALRAAGDISWEIGPDGDFNDLIHYETMLDLFFLGKKMVGMCQYPVDRCPSEILEGILNTHKIAVIDHDVCPNFHYVPARLLIAQDQDVRKRNRVEWMTSQLLRARKAEEELELLNADIEKRVADRTADLQAAFNELETFSYSVSHDLRAPIRSIRGFTQAVAEDQGATLSEKARDYILRVHSAACEMERLIDALLRLARLSQKELSFEAVDLSKMAKELLSELQLTSPEREVSTVVAESATTVRGDPELLRIVMANLLSNAWKYSSKKPRAIIEFGTTSRGGAPVFFVKDNGVGFDPTHSDRLFGVFQRLHSVQEFDGIGIGLSTVQKIIRRHGGQVWAEGEVDRGATFYFSIPG